MGQKKVKSSSPQDAFATSVSPNQQACTIASIETVLSHLRGKSQTSLDQIVALLFEHTATAKFAKALHKILKMPNNLPMELASKQYNEEKDVLIFQFDTHFEIKLDFAILRVNKVELHWHDDHLQEVRSSHKLYGVLVAGTNETKVVISDKGKYLVMDTFVEDYGKHIANAVIQSDTQAWPSKVELLNQLRVFSSEAEKDVPINLMGGASEAIVRAELPWKLAPSMFHPLKIRIEFFSGSATLQLGSLCYYTKSITIYPTQQTLLLAQSCSGEMNITSVKGKMNGVISYFMPAMVSHLFARLSQFDKLNIRKLPFACYYSLASLYMDEIKFNATQTTIQHANVELHPCKSNFLQLHQKVILSSTSDTLPHLFLVSHLGNLTLKDGTITQKEWKHLSLLSVLQSIPCIAVPHNDLLAQVVFAQAPQITISGFDSCKPFIHLRIRYMQQLDNELQEDYDEEEYDFVQVLRHATITIDFMSLQFVVCYDEKTFKYPFCFLDSQFQTRLHKCAKFYDLHWHCELVQK